MAQILRDDQVGRQALHQLGVHCVDAFAATHEFPHLAIDFSGGGLRVYSWADQRGLLGHFGRKIALVSHANDAIARANGIEDFGGGGQQRYDAHARSLVREVALAQSRAASGLRCTVCHSLAALKKQIPRPPCGLGMTDF